MVESVNTTRVEIPLLRKKAEQALVARAQAVPQVEKPADTVKVITDYSLGTQVTEILNPTTGIVVAQLPSSSALYALQSQNEAAEQISRPVLVSSRPDPVGQSTFDPFFQLVEENIEKQHVALTHEHAAYAAAIKSVVQSAQPDIRLLNETV